MAVTMVNLSNAKENKLRVDGRINGKECYYLEEYRGLDVIRRAKKAAMSVSNNGKCWWVHDYVYRELTWRNAK